MSGSVQSDLIVSKLIVLIRELIEENRSDFNHARNFKVRVEGLPGKYYLDSITGSYEDSLQNLVHKLMWRHELYALFIELPRELEKIEGIVASEPDGIYKPDAFGAEMAEEEEALNSLEDQINEIYFKTIKNTALMLREFDHFDSYEFDAEGY